ncbi:nitroimidazol reductase NimA-like FMN-containing flavoprotein (pyridoxamine 5'-phosphate oxidase superfamily) [Lipingzhangella halophila]|uniref:Nitroimidazol reductase NimA-like FMN-containing flavoprotein (Pyridoxamine 5'-phosphate oxidase superfamily) n=1 Tax=Lipingzhangella halophila TaxID=1783352 RepID=A0A7W7W357_9ACTN|nr:pyridoxamine 5'-phosphate oxidase family protein [Lipingzhangella halophila]MBB4932697.1 nitroimidazol reductase NimA-like FMN-containing flavoprotein (pyridoxamine 5'-phosphate oxidase superfamily) [Lipingzhangella halophila]
MAADEPVAEVLESPTERDRPAPPGPADAEPAPWASALANLDQARTYWLATVRPSGRPHSVPVLAVVVDGAAHFCANESSRKARNLAADPHCVLTASGESLDMVVEGAAVPVTDPTAVRGVAAAYAATYGWAPEERGGALWADGAPTAGPPPYRVFRVEPTTVLGFPTDDSTVPTRWRF